MLAAVGLALVWSLFNLGRFAVDTDARVRLIVGGVFVVLILLRRDSPTVMPPFGARLALMGGVAAVVSVLGVVFGVNQLEWIGLVVILYACFRWSLPPVYAANSFTAMFSRTEAALISWVAASISDRLCKAVTMAWRRSTST